MSITRNRELSQFGSFLYINDSSQNIGIATETTPFVGIGTANPTSKLTVRGDVNVSGVITASAFYGTFAGVIGNSNYASVAGVATVAVGLRTTSNVNTSGIITASAFYENGVRLINPDLQTWFIGTGSSIYRLNGNVGIGLSTPTEKLTVNANVSASRFISTITSGTSPFTVLSNTLVTNLNADFLRGKTPPSGDIVGTTDTQTLTNKTLITPTIGSGGANFSGTTGTTNLRASTTASGTLTLPAETGTLVSTASAGAVTSSMILDGTIVNADISNSASIAITKLAASTISGISLGNNLATLTIGPYLNGTSYNGSAAVTISANASSSNTANTLIARDASGDFTAGTINCSSLNATFDVTAANINSTSDENLKTNIKTIENSLETVKSLRGVSFDWKETSKPSYGVIAQEIEKILPELIATNSASSPIYTTKSVNYNGLIGVLIEAVKELSAEVEELKSKLI